MKYEDITKEIKKKVYRPIYFLCGDEQYYIDVISDYFEKKLLSDSEKDFNLTVMYGRDVEARDIITAAKRYPMMSDKQVIIVKEAQSMASLDLLESYIKEPMSSTILVICYKHKKLDKRKLIGKLLSTSKNVAFMESKKLYDNQLAAWLTKYAKSQSHEMEVKAAVLMCESIGNDLSRLHNEMEKLFMNVGKGEKILSNHVEKYIGISKDYNAFELNNAVGTRDITKINKIVSYFEYKSKDASLLFLISILYNYFTSLLTYSFVRDKNDKPALAKAMGVHPFFLKDYVAAARIYTPAKIVDNIALLREFDLKAKGVGAGKVSAGDLLKEMMFKLTH